MKASLSPERWEQVQRLFDEVVDLEPAVRAVRLDEVCRDDLDLREEVESLLAAYAQADDLLQSLDQLAPARPAPSTPSRMPMRVAHYEVLEKIGGGGMGVVYKARDTKLDRLIALKFLPPGLSANAEAKRRFTQEAKAASALDHNNICAIHEIGETDDGHLFIAMAYYDGQTLKKKIKQGPLPLAEALDIATQMTRGLEKAHAKDIVHRDIKPANVMVTDDGVVKIVDFGLAKISDVQITKTGTTMGTVAYMSPEQARGNKVDHRTDVWSLGVVLYEMFTGERPFQGMYDQAIIYSLLHEEPAPITTINPELPEALEHVVAMCIEKDPAQRYPTMTDLLADLEVFTQGTGTSLNTALRAIRRRRSKARRRIAGIGVLVSLLLILAIPAVRQAILSGSKPLKLAVLPFTNVSANLDDQVFIDGLVYQTTSMLTSMEQFEGKLSVTSARDVLLAEDLTTSAAIDKFKVSLLVTGSVQFLDEQVVLTLELVDEQGDQVRSRRLEKSMTNIAALQEGVVRTLADLLQIELDPNAEQLLTAGGTTAPSAYDFYIQGLGYLQRYEDEANVDEAIDRFEQAIVEDSRYTLAYAALGEAYWRKYEKSKKSDWVDVAIRNGEQAVALDDELAPVHVTMGMIYKGTGAPEKAEDAFKRALQLHPGNAFAHQQLAAAYYLQGKTDLAETHYKKAIELKPDYWDFYNVLGWVYQAQGLHEKAAEQYREVVKLRPDNPEGYNNLGAQYERLAQYDEAARWYREATQANPNAVEGISTAQGNLAGIAYRKKNFAEAARLFEQAHAIAPTETKAWINLPNAYHWAGQTEKAREAWHRVIELEEANLEVNPNDGAALNHLAEAYAKTADLETARVRLGHLSELPGKSWRVLFGMTRTYEYLGDRPAALHYLEEALKTGLRRSSIEFHAVWLDGLMADTRYQDLIQRYLDES